MWTNQAWSYALLSEKAKHHPASIHSNGPECKHSEADVNVSVRIYDTLSAHNRGFLLSDKSIDLKKKEK